MSNTDENGEQGMLATSPTPSPRPPRPLPTLSTRPKTELIASWVTPKGESAGSMRSIHRCQVASSAATCFVRVSSFAAQLVTG